MRNRGHECEQCGEWIEWCPDAGAVNYGYWVHWGEPEFCGLRNKTIGRPVKHQHQS